MKFITLYKEWAAKGEMSKNGLCDALPDSLSNSKEFQLIEPTNEEAENNWDEGGGRIYWGNENRKVFTQRNFTPLRQNIMLLCACMREEY